MKNPIPYLILLVVTTSFPGCVLLENLVSNAKEPKPENTSVQALSREKQGNDFYTLGSNWLKQNEAGIWELYVEGEPYELGIVRGKLSQDLIAQQEDIFVGKIREMIPSDRYLQFLKYFIGIFNSSLDKHIDREHQLEIYGISRQAPERYEYVGPSYYRMMNYHAAHDIGHALQNMNLTSQPMVGCTAFSLKGGASKDGKMLMGRNFDFHMGDEFAKNKVVAFYNPDRGMPFMMITWPGMIGAVSGMNKEGLALTLNAAKSGIPKKTGTPVSLIARKILQNASNIREAFNIAQKYQSFVSESFVIASAEDGESVVIEKRPGEMSIYRPHSDTLVCTNHFQSEPFRNSELTQEHLEKNPTLYRYKRVKELIAEKAPLGKKEVATILRDQKGRNDKNIGMGNEMAINQLLAHHSVIFKPEEKKFWISAFPYQLGEYVAYDLDDVFSKQTKAKQGHSIRLHEETILQDDFLGSKDYKRFRKYEHLRDSLIILMNQEPVQAPSEELVEDFIQANPEYFDVYMVLGDLYRSLEEYGIAKEYYSTALEKAIPRQAQRSHVKTGLKKCKKKEK